MYDFNKNFIFLSNFFSSKNIYLKLFVTPFKNFNPVKKNFTL